MRDVVGACPLDCPDGCSWVVTVDEVGSAVQLRGNPDHPFTAGGLCKKVNPWLEYADDPRRLLHPLRRSGAKGDGTFEPVSWDDALAEIADRLASIRAEWGGEAIWPYAGTGNVGFIQGSGLPAGARLWNSLGASAHAGTICSISGHVGLSYTTGSATGMDPEDMAHAGTILLWGANVLVTNQHLWPFVEQARRHGATIVAVDPVGTRTARRSDLHIAPRPGTDGALALGLCRELIDRGAVDDQALRRRSVGFDEFVRLADEWTLERTAHECGLEGAEIAALAELIASAPPLAIKLGQGMQRHANGGQAARTISCLSAITGSFTVRGGGLVYSTGPHYERNRRAATMPELRPHPVRSLAMTNLVRNLEQLHDPPVHALIITAANPVVSNPDTAGVRRALSRDDLFTVAVDLYPTETTAYADIILPSTMQHEQFEMNDSFSHLYLHWNEKAVEAPGECRSHTRIFAELATALAIHDDRFADPALQADELNLATALLDAPHFAEAGIDLDTLRRRGWVRLPGTQDPFLPFEQRFATPSGRFEFTSDRAEADGHGRLPTYRPAAETPDVASAGPAPLMLIANGSDWYLNSTFAGTSRTRSRTEEPPVVIHPKDAAELGLLADSTVEVGNDRGSFRARLKVSAEGTRPGVVTTSKGWWGHGVNMTVREEDSDMGRGAVFHDNAVWVRPLHRP